MENWKKNDIFTAKIEDMSDTGEGIGKTDGFTWFIKDAVIGDLVEAGAMKVKKTYGYARLIKVLEPSPYRVTPPCPVARQCGGCQIQALEYGEQLAFKERKICSNLRRIGGLETLVLVDEDGKERQQEAGNAGGSIGARAEASCAAGQTGDGRIAKRTAGIPVYPIMGMEYPWRYRNKAQFPFGRDKNGRIISGFYAGRTHSIIQSEDCLLGVEENRTILQCIREHMETFQISPYDESSHSGLIRHVLIRKGFRTGELMVCLVINGDAKELKAADVLVKRLCERFPGDGAGAGNGAGIGNGAGAGAVIPEPAADQDERRRKEAGRQAGPAPRMASISCSVNRERTNVIMGRDIVNLYGPGWITDYIGTVQYRISPLSFYQVNPVQTEKLYSTALEYAGLTGDEVVWDLYCGIGTISLFLAQKAKKVYGVEIVPQAIDDARANARLNGITNAEFFVGKAEEVLPEQYEKNRIYADVIVVDPPRKGCDTVCLDTIVKMQPKRVVYVSCDSATLARDVKYLGERGYAVRKVRGCDMFSQGGHVETVCLLSNRKPDGEVLFLCKCR
ncbi:MAG: 23S rRNA (uracil(1939)-C(5))-methyltransferase RlmD [Eubacteriales bacterium]|nr:23S rRNA (uracil(1939)-C(5))-methyltransferase RlmD [Eubacteriales bacterium]